ncbi:tol-pal system-associated acyl-CoA thioesterase [Ursidibacter maritimus]|uniref:Tol-pal system-associated acyl-CoA thioesterase n=1 Tax=Ursidibacter maritimus TaxID=1331689 RepID=A0A949SXK8_9PAST|nr:tol-pal system-associated acyl-CoA thioesterase [Ursidibacter maritimus]KAE9542024.1 tol-pal system-associated acyl-CoA thioesterase [Ursidibacter maritimus]MBV6523173.1 tol-pal system-associated acyl-CoA thioesterase [Ursidibacter maritimus]MBV6525385.1 tol-pal system-associated acyl-CoA thioesterase [Ursidibacter maritimus]MBV6527475.1 tol-pal system-associated acyl-CoA thioesterase [Ursidibacter maritimus]MBV6529264.1 tol-pal system-associated acyl-CoA thioesterase [Ursidibacter maritimu
MNFPIRIYYENTDAGGVVYHAQYLNFFERARTEFLRSLSFSQENLLRDRIAFVVKKIEIDYKVPARLDDLLNVETTIIDIKKASILFQQKLLKDNLCLSEARVLVACVDLNRMKPIAVPQEIYQAMQQAV